MKNILFILFFTLACTCSFSQKNVGQNSAEEKIVKFYPNPASDVITFDINHVVEKGYVIQIYNFLGRQVLVVPITSNHFTVTLKDFFRGPYVFQLRDKNGVIIEANKFQVNK